MRQNETFPRFTQKKSMFNYAALTLIPYLPAQIFYDKTNLSLSYYSRNNEAGLLAKAGNKNAYQQLNKFLPLK